MRVPCFASVVLCLALMALAAPTVRPSEPLPGGDVITGAGATFPAPVYAQWALSYKNKTGLKVNYEPIGSGGGITQIKNKTVDFGATDEPLSDKALDDAGLVQFPTVIGGVVVVYNVEGVAGNELKLPPDVLADIYLGEITKWNDGRIKKANPGLDLPNLKITVVRRSDGSGTTYLFTSYLSQVSQTWKTKVGTGKAVEWPGDTVGGKGNPGVAATVFQNKGAIGYVEYAYAVFGKKKLAMAQLLSKDGEYVKASNTSFRGAFGRADWSQSKNFSVSLINLPGKGSWPITGATYILVHKEPANAAKARAVLEFFYWAYENGGKTAERLDFIPLPPAVVAQVQDAWAERIRVNGKAVWTKK